MKLKFFETKPIIAHRQPVTKQQLIDSGIQCSREEFQQNFDAIIDFQTRLEAVYKEAVEKLHFIDYEDDPGFDVPQVTSMIDMSSHRDGWAYFKHDMNHEEYEFNYAAAERLIAKIFAKHTPELNVVINKDQTLDEELFFDVSFKADTPLEKLNIDFSAPNGDDSKHSIKARKALKWW